MRFLEYFQFPNYVYGNGMCGGYDKTENGWGEQCQRAGWMSEVI